jgi:hypothetical protein
MRKLQLKQCKVKFQYQFTSRGHNSLLRSQFGAQEKSMEISWTIEDNHGARFGIWVHKNVQEEKEDTCSIQG